MSDLHCPARLYVARPGEARGDGSGAVPDDAGLSDRGREQVRDLAGRLGSKRIATVYAGGEVRRGAQSAALAGDVLDVPVRTLEDLHPTRLREALEQVADQHRGESVLVFSTREAMAPALPGLDGELPRCETVLVEVDADGWRILGGREAGNPAP